MATKVKKITDVGGDVLEVRGTDGTSDCVAYGWVSATTNHYRPADYDTDGNRNDNAKPKKMTKAEKNDYALRILREQNPALD
jgi:hypothetical protein